jgi:hypothetical protein
MTSKQAVTFISLCAVVVALVIVWQYWTWRWGQNVVDLNGTVQAGVQMQLVADDFNDQIGHYPTHDELLHVLLNISTFKEGVSPYQTNTIVQVLDNTGGWVYNTTNGEVRINYSGIYEIGFNSWVKVAQMRFHLPVKIEVFRHGRPEVLDYSSLGNWSNSEQPEILQIITNWASTNLIRPN